MNKKKATKQKSNDEGNNNNNNWWDDWMRMQFTNFAYLSKQLSDGEQTPSVRMKRLMTLYI